MSGISSGVGIFSGINSRQIVDQLIQVSARPREFAQRRIAQLQQQSAGYLDINSRLSALKSAAGRFSTQRVFEAATATSSDDKILTATASTGTAVGAYRFQVDRLVTTQQLLSRGFIDAKNTGLGATKFTIESSQGRIDTPTKLATLNGGTGVVRGRIVVRDSGGTNTTVDLTKVESLNEVITAINQAAAGRVVARADGDRLVLTETAAAAGSGTLSVVDAEGSAGVVASLGLDVTTTASGTPETLTGRRINTLGRSTTLASLNDGLGVAISRTESANGALTPDFVINTRDGTAINVDLGDIFELVTPPGGGPPVRTKVRTAVADLGGVIDRINQAGNGKVTASINSDGTALRLVDNTTGVGLFDVAELNQGTTARDLGLVTSTTGSTITGGRIQAALNSTLAKNFFGGLGVAQGTFAAITRDGQTSNIDLNLSGSFTDLANSISAQSGGRLTLELDSTATGVVLRDNSTGTGTLTVIGEAAESLGLNVTNDADGVVQGARLQKRYLAPSTLLSSLNGGRGVGTGTIRITNSYGFTRNINISADNLTVSDLLRNINAAGADIEARLNDRGDGIEIREIARASGAGVRKITVEDASGSVARSLNLIGEAAGVGAQNRIDGSFEREITFAATDTLQQVADKINAGNPLVSATVINDGTPGRPFRLAITARSSGEAGRFTIDTGGFDLGLSTLSEGTNARVFFGSTDPAQAVLISSSTNSVTNVIDGLTLNLVAPSSTPATVTVSRDLSGIEKNVKDFVDAFNGVIERIDLQARFDPETNRRGALLGDSSIQQIRGELFSLINQRPIGISGRFQLLSQVGITTTDDGKLQVNNDRLRAAIDQDAQAVRDLFAARVQTAAVPQRPVLPGVPGVTVRDNTPGAFTSLGVGERFAQAVDRFIRPVDGVLTRRSKTITDQVTFQNTRIASLNNQLEAQRARLEAQFLNMERAIGRLQGQQGALGNIRSII